MPNSDRTHMKPSIQECLNVANSLIQTCNLTVPLVNHIDDIDSNLIVLLYEKITGSFVPDLDSCERSEEEVLQAVINALSLDILHLPLSHITGEAVVAGDVLAVYNLLRVLEGISLHSDTNFKQKICRLKRRENVQEQTTTLRDIEKVFEKNAGLKLEATLIKNSHLKPSLTEKDHHTAKSYKKSTYPHSCHKSYLLPYSLRKKHTKHPPVKKIYSEKPEFLQKNEKSCKVNDRTNFIQELLEEFPCIQIPPSVLKNIESMYVHQLTRMHKLMKKCLSKKTFVEAENIFERQSKLSGLLKKDILQQEYLKEVKKERENERKIKYSLRDSRLKSAKMKHYSDEFILDMRRKMLKRNIAEEQIFKKVFKEVMDIQNEHVNDLCQQVKESRMKDDEKYLNYLNSLENLYQSQYLALAEEIANEKSETQLRLNAERQALAKAERELRETLKNEIRFMQRVIVEQTEDCHFREMDAALCIDKFRKKLH